ncbi:MAG: hypothetical protein ABUL62_19380 [Myxococcales bacterium]
MRSVLIDSTEKAKVKASLDLSFAAASLNAAGTYKNDPKEPRYDCASFVNIEATLQGLTGGTLDVTIQDSPDGLTWYDFARFPQIAAGAAKATYSYNPTLSNAIVAIGNPTTDPATPAPGIVANAVRGGHPMSYLRAVAVAGAGASAGVAQTIIVNAR